MAPTGINFSTSYSIYWRLANIIARSLSIKGRSSPVLIVWTTTEILSRSVEEATKASRFSSTNSISGLRKSSGVGKVANLRSGVTR